MRKYLPILCIAPLLITSCGDVTQEIWIERDHSGRAHYSYDMTQVISMLQMFEGQKSTDSASTAQPKDELQALILGLEENSDTTFNISDIAPPKEIADGKLDELPAFLKQSNIRIANDEGKYLATLMLDFESFEQIHQQLLEVPIPESNEEFPLIIDYLGSVKLTDRSFVAPPFSMQEKDKSEEDKLGDDMVKQLFSVGNFISIYHMPSRVKSCSVPGAEIKGKSVTIVQPLKKIMDSDKMDGLEIKMKKYRSPKKGRT